MPIQLARKRKSGFDGSQGEKVGANFSEVAYFLLWFDLINFCLSRIGVITNVKKTENINIDIADMVKPSIGITDLMEADRADKLDTSLANHPLNGQPSATSTTRLIWEEMLSMKR